ncbi:uncharacterized protein [Solanum lycopersicum]|uniref:uncharacterized protein n=1 Tax=Solanum lycopersicum TaxID=4081 RepID=UPI0037485CF6
MNTSILMRHSGIWVNELQYESYKIDGFVVGDSISFSNLKAAIAAELDIDVSRKEIEIRYIVEEVRVANVIINSDIVDVKTGLIYKDKATLVDVMTKYKIKNNFNCKVKRSDQQSYVLVCFSDKCGWTMKASCRKKSDIFIVRNFNSEHTCPMRERVLTKVQATVGFVSGVTALKLVNYKRIYTPRDIIDDIREYYGVEISYQQAWRAKERALSMIRGKPSAGYRRMPRYIHMLKTVYPDSYIRMHKTEEDEFMYLFIALRPFIRGFKYCKPVVVVDGAYLSGAYKGTFVSASTLDGADRNESIMKSVRIVFPDVPHYACIWHLWKNVCGNFKRSRKAISDLFYSMAKAYRKKDFDKLMAKVDRIDHRVKEYLEYAGYEKWSRVHATVNRGRMMTSNIAECINGCLVEARQLTILEFLEEVRILFGSWHCKNREVASYTKDTLGRKFEELLIINAAKSSKMENVTDMNPYCSDYYKPDALAKTYEIPMVPMPDKKDWSDPKHVVAETVYPPRYRRSSGRPRKRRRKNADEKISVNTNCCGQCGQEGHNRRTCTFYPKEK